ncbi:MAG: hypothetical protein DHS20C18_02710 [Saprospiraceae bacterium]|nr:MAG: hypothetical protein DHS20C18_02710 [Saprospiraceae bacterium]
MHSLIRFFIGWSIYLSAMNLSGQNLHYAQQGTFQLADPILTFDSVLFQSSATIRIGFEFEETSLYYTLDGKEPTTTSLRYNQPINVKESSTLKVRAFHPDCQNSNVVSEQFIKVVPPPKMQSIILQSAPNSKYAGNGASTLFDLEKGSLNFQDGKWLGFQGDNLEIVAKLEKTTTIKGLTVSGLANQSGWIFPIHNLAFYTSVDGENFELIEQKAFSEGDQSFEAGPRFWQIDFAPQQTRFIKIIAENQGVIPDWHQGAGTPAWLFVDEILLR